MTKLNNWKFSLKLFIDHASSFFVIIFISHYFHKWSATFFGTVHRARDKLAGKYLKTHVSSDWQANTILNERQIRCNRRVLRFFLFPSCIRYFSIDIFFSPYLFVDHTSNRPQQTISLSLNSSVTCLHRYLFQSITFIDSYICSRCKKEKWFIKHYRSRFVEIYKYYHVFSYQDTYMRILLFAGISFHHVRRLDTRFTRRRRIFFFSLWIVGSFVIVICNADLRLVRFVPLDDRICYYLLLIIN